MCLAKGRTSTCTHRTLPVVSIIDSFCFLLLMYSETFCLIIFHSLYIGLRPTCLRYTIHYDMIETKYNYRIVIVVDTVLRTSATRPGPNHILEVGTVKGFKPTIKKYKSIIKKIYNKLSEPRCSNFSIVFCIECVQYTKLN